MLCVYRTDQKPGKGSYVLTSRQYVCIGRKLTHQTWTEKDLGGAAMKHRTRWVEVLVVELTFKQCHKQREEN